MTYSRNSQLDDTDNVTTITFNAPTVSLVYEHLVTYDLIDEAKGTFTIKPQLAESWDVTDPKKMVFKLRKGIKFSDGSDLTAEVVKWNLDRVGSHPKSSGKHLVEAVESIEVVDPTTVRINLKFPSATALMKLSDGVVGSGAYASAMASKAFVDANGPDALRDKPVGTGPMVLAEWVKGSKETFKKRDGYWQNGADGQPLPYLDSVVSRLIMDSAVAFTELRSGTLTWPGNINLSDIAAVKSNPNLVYHELPFGGFVRFIYAMNQYDGPFKDNVKLRKSANHAIDREQMAKTMGFGLAKAAYWTYWMPYHLGWDETIPKYEYNVAKAKQYMTEAGYPNGIDITLTTIARDPDRKISEIAKFMWDAVGIRITIDSMERSAGLARYRAGQATLGFYGDYVYPDPDIFAPRGMTCNSLNNWFNYCNNQFDACIAEASSLSDDKKRHEIYKRCLAMFMEDGYLGSGYLEPTYFVYDKSMKGLVVHFTGTDMRWLWLDK
ncbi:MAG: ABC transporter substrate-binding protein [Chloroflexi bacterium]|nr:ABC transporter substrate-binding protein [Chloroflexota bacterium]